VQRILPKYDAPFDISRRFQLNSIRKRVVCSSRRDILKRLILVGSLCGVSVPSDVVATESEMKQSSPIFKPRAPKEALLPATRIRYEVNRAIDICKTDGDNLQPENQIQSLEDILLNTNKYAVPKDKIRGISASTPSALYEKSYGEQLSKMSTADKMLAIPVQFGERDTAARLKRRQNKLAEGNPIRAAFNFYASQLQFKTDSFLLNANASEKRKLVQEDAIPDIKSVIVSDLDLRDLYRNQILECWDDAAAELKYQMKEDTFNADELNNILLKMKLALDQWFSFIPEEDVKEAYETVVAENS